MAITIEQLRQWSEHLCRERSDARETAKLFELSGALAEHGDYWDLTPPPAGTTHALLVNGVGGIGHIDVRLVEPVTRAQLDAKFGDGDELPMLDDGPTKIAYHVELKDAPYTCEVIAAFDRDDPSKPEARAHNVVLRRDRA